MMILDNRMPVPPDIDEVHWLNEAADKATIKAIVDGTSSARSWGDIQSTWGYVNKPKPHVVRVIKVKTKKVRVRFKKEKRFSHRSLNKLAYILSTNGMPMDEAVHKAIELLKGNNE